MNICVEGPDNSGKTNLVEALSEIYERSVIHATKPEDDIDAWSKYLDEVEDSGNVILDRSHAVSGLIYDVAVRKQLPYFGREHVERVVADTLLIVCLPAKELVLGDKTRHQMPGVRENHEAIYDAYHDLFGTGKVGNLSVFIYDWTKHGAVDAMNWIEDILGGPLY